MTKEQIRLSNLIQRFKALGCWYMVEVLEQMLRETR